MALSDVLEVTVVVVGGKEVEDNDGVVMRGRNYLELVELEPKYPASVLRDRSNTQIFDWCSWVKGRLQIPDFDFPIVSPADYSVVIKSDASD